MAFLEIKKFGCPVLRQKAPEIETVTEEVQRLVDDMFDTMYAAEGIGLAAPQIGVSKRVIVVDVSRQEPNVQPVSLINPELIWSVGEEVREEGCLSLPGVLGDVKRATQVRLKALDRDGQTLEMELNGMFARVTQHEIDHLDGVMVIDHFGAVKRNLLRGQLRRLKREGSRQTPEPAYVPEEAVVGGDQES